MLLFAEQFAGAANFQILAGEHEAGPQVGGLFDGLQPFERVLGHGARPGGGEVGVGLVVAAAHAPAQLVQLRQAQFVGALDDDGVGAGYVDAGFDNGGAHQHVEAAVVEVAHHRFQLALAHLPVGDAHPGVGHQLADVLGGACHGVDVVVQVVNLTAAQQLAQDRFLDGGVVFLLHEGFHRQPLLRRRGDNGNIAHAAHRHVQGTRDRRGGEGEDVALGAHFLQALLVAHAEAVLLVDDDQPQVVEGHRLLQ